MLPDMMQKGVYLSYTLARTYFRDASGFSIRQSVAFKLSVGILHDVGAVLALESSNREVPSGHVLEMGYENGVHEAAAMRRDILQCVS